MCASSEATVEATVWIIFEGSDLRRVAVDVETPAGCKPRPLLRLGLDLRVSTSRRKVIVRRFRAARNLF
jgi:hypothetical protein